MNRGESALRCIRAVRSLRALEGGPLQAIALYTEPDHRAMFVREADEAFALGGQTATESYINTDAVINAIKESGADAVHPGYGFFSENADFARAITDRLPGCDDSNLVITGCIGHPDPRGHHGKVGSNMTSDERQLFGGCDHAAQQWCG